MSYTTVLSDQERTSRGKVRCDSCGRTIAKGTRYHEQRACDYRDIWTWRGCPACDEAIVWAYDDADDDNIGTLGWLKEWADDMLDAHLSRHVDVLINCLTFPDLHDPARTIAGVSETARQEVAAVEELDRTYPLTDPERIAAFIWRMRTSNALHPQGVTNTPEEKLL